ncbi:MAG: hypothetical protein HY821_08310 [Acidobacteria bacterium]|nr:hypothetical protein [Acidobacteriota bacterium]
MQTRLSEQKDHPGYSNCPQASLEMALWESDAEWPQGIAPAAARLYQFATLDKPWPVVVLTRATALARLPSVTIPPVTSTLRGAASQVFLIAEAGMTAALATDLH